MPFIQLQTGKRLSDSDKTTIHTRLGEIITVIPGKNAGNLMIALHDGVEMCFAGKQREDCLYMSILLHGAASHDQKTQLVLALYELLAATTGIDRNNMYITVQELDNWGAIGQYL